MKKSHESTARSQSLKVNSNNKSFQKLFVYFGVFAIVLSLVSTGYYAQKDDSASSRPGVVAATSESMEPAVDPLTPGEVKKIDDSVATSIVARYAVQTNAPIAQNAVNLSTSIEVKNQISQTDDTAVSKPQIVEPTSSTRSIIKYKAKAGDTVKSVAQKYNITPKTLKWANDISSDNIEKDRVVIIPPVDGVLYTAKRGDTIDSIAKEFKADKERVVSFNNLEVGGVKPDMKIIIPDGTLPEDQRPGYEPPVASASPSYTTQQSRPVTRQQTGGVDLSRVNASAGNAYALGNCTWYAYERRAQLGKPIGSFWGNANTWAVSATAAGFAVDGSPRPGDIIQTAAGGYGYGHVGIVESVNENGSLTISEMNYAGFNIVSNRTIPAGQVSQYRYIH